MAIRQSPLEIIVNALNTVVKSAVGATQLIYDPALSFTTATSHLRRVKHTLSSPASSNMSLLAFNRGILRPTEEINQRGRFTARGDTKDENDNYKTYKIFFGSFEYRYIYYANDMRSIEGVELDFACGAGIKGIKSITADVGMSEDWTYHTHWGELEDIVHTEVDEGVFVSSISGVGEVRGFFVLNPEVDAEAILTIPTKIYGETTDVDFEGFTLPE